MPPSVRQLVARNLRHLRRRDELLWTEIAEHCGVKERQVYRWARDEGQTPSHENLQALAKLFGVSAGYFLEDHKESRRA